MMNVSGPRLILFLTLSFLFLAGCEEPEVTLGTLGKKFSAPTLAGTSPFSQDMDSNGYVRFQGACDPRTENVYISLDGTNFNLVAATPNYSGTTLNGNEVNDTSCTSDGVFDFYVTESDLTTWGFGANSSVSTIYLRGTSSLGYTNILTLHDPNPHNGNNDNGVPDKVVLEKFNPQSFAGSSQCEYFWASVRTSQGYTTLATADVTFSLDKKISGTLYAGTSFYASADDCANQTNAKLSATIASGKYGINIYYKFPDNPLDETLYFRTSSVNLPTATSEFTGVVLRDSIGSRFWTSSYGPYRISRNVCVQGNFNARTYANTSSSVASWVPQVVGTNGSKLFFYSDATCATRITTISASGGNSTYYMKYTGSETDTSTLTLKLNHTVDTGTYGNYDDIAQTIEIDRDTTASAIRKIEFYTSDVITRGSCYNTQVSTYNKNGALTSPTALTAHLSSNSNAVTFYSSSTDCEGSTNGFTSLSLVKAQTTLYYKTLASPAVTETLSIKTLTSLGLNDIIANRSYKIYDVPTTLKATFNGDPQLNYPVAGTCVAYNLNVGLADSINDVFYPNVFGASFGISVYLPSGYTAYSDAGCTNAVGSSQAMFIGSSANVTGAYTMFIKASGTPTPGSFYIQTSSGPTTLTPKSFLLNVIN